MILASGPIKGVTRRQRAARPECIKAPAKKHPAVTIPVPQRSGCPAGPSLQKRWCLSPASCVESLYSIYSCVCIPYRYLTGAATGTNQRWWVNASRLRLHAKLRPAYSIAHHFSPKGCSTGIKHWKYVHYSVLLTLKKYFAVAKFYVHLYYF